MRHTRSSFAILVVMFALVHQVPAQSAKPIVNLAFVRAKAAKMAATKG